MEADEAVVRVARTSYGRLVALISASTHDVASAEDALSDALVAALRTWPERGIPSNPEAWMLTAARRSLIGEHRKRAVAERTRASVGLLAGPAEPMPSGQIPDKRLELMFACTHPAIDPGVHSALMLQVVLGLDAVRIAAAFLEKPATLGQRLVRAKSRLRRAGIPFEVPRREVLGERCTAVLDAIYAAYGTGWDRREPDGSELAGLAAEAIDLGRIVTELLPDSPEARGLLALMLHSTARAGARRDGAGRFVPLADHDTRRWDMAMIEEAERHLARAMRLGQVGPYQLQAAVQSIHNRRIVTGATDWAAIAAVYDALVAIEPTVGAIVARAAALLEAAGPDRARDALAGLTAAETDRYQPYWAVLAEIERRAGRADLARRCANRAIELADDPAVVAHLRATFDR